MKNDNLSISNLVDRATSKTPSFWKRFQKYAAIAGVLAGTVLTGGFAVPAAVTTIATIVASMSGAAITIAQLTKEDAADDSAEPAK